MITLTILLFVLFGMFWVGMFLTGALIQALVWLFINLPVSMILIAFGLVLCCTIILIPVGIKLMGAGLRILIPGI